MIWWGFFRQTAPAAMPVHVGANSLKNPHHIIILQFSEVVKGHAIYPLYLVLSFENQDAQTLHWKLHWAI